MVRDEESSQQPDETPSEQSVEKLDENPRRHDPLLVAAAAAVSLTLVALVAIAGAAYANHWEGFWRGMGQPYATTLAALAAVSAGAIALHNSRSQLEELRAQRTQDQTRWEQQREQDQERWEDQRKRDASKDLRSRFSEITTQLADTSPTVRRSGAYAMAALANDWRSIGEEAEMKVCFGVLAAYLTTPNPAYTDEPKPNAGDDGPVRALIVALLSRNAGSGLEDLWGSSSLLSGADLRGVSFNAPVNRVDFSDADLTGATFTKSDFKGVRFLSANLSKASLTYLDLQGAQLSFAKLMETDLYRADLRKAQLDHAELLGADLDDAMLAGASMMYADLRGVDLSRTVLDGVRLEGVDYDDETKWPDGFTPPPKPAWQ